MNVCSQSAGTCSLTICVWSLSADFQTVVDLSLRADRSAVRTYVSAVVQRHPIAAGGGGGSSFERGCICDQPLQLADVRLMQLRLRARLEACVAALETDWTYARQTDIRKTLFNTHTHTHTHCCCSYWWWWWWWCTSTLYHFLRKPQMASKCKERTMVCLQCVIKRLSCQAILWRSFFSLSLSRMQRNYDSVICIFPVRERVRRLYVECSSSPPLLM